MTVTSSNERATIRKIREAVARGALRAQFTPTEVNGVLRIHWPAVFLPKHRVSNLGGQTDLFERVRRGVYELKQPLLESQLADEFVNGWRPLHPAMRLAGIYRNSRLPRC